MARQHRKTYTESFTGSQMQFQYPSTIGSNSEIISQESQLINMAVDLNANYSDETIPSQVLMHFPIIQTYSSGTNDDPYYDADHNSSAASSQYQGAMKDQEQEELLQQKSESQKSPQIETQFNPFDTDDLDKKSVFEDTNARNTIFGSFPVSGYDNPYTKHHPSISRRISVKESVAERHEKRLSIFTNWGINDDLSHNKRNSEVLENLINNNSSATSVLNPRTYEEETESLRSRDPIDMNSNLTDVQKTVAPYSGIPLRSNSLRRRVTIASRSLKRLNSLKESSEDSSHSTPSMSKKIEPVTSNNLSLKRSNATRRKIGWLSNILLLFKKLKSKMAKKWRMILSKSKSSKPKTIRNPKVSEPTLIRLPSKSKKQDNYYQRARSTSFIVPPPISSPKTKLPPVPASVKYAGPESETTDNADSQEGITSNTTPNKDTDRVLELWNHYLKTVISNRIQIKLEIDNNLAIHAPNRSRQLQTAGSQMYLPEQMPHVSGPIIHSKRESIFDEILTDYVSTSDQESEFSTSNSTFDNNSSISSAGSFDIPIISIVQDTPNLASKQPTLLRPDYHIQHQPQPPPSPQEQGIKQSQPTSPISTQFGTNERTQRDSIFSFGESLPAIIIGDQQKAAPSPQQKRSSFSKTSITKDQSTLDLLMETSSATSSQRESSLQNSKGRNFDSFSFQYSLISERSDNAGIYETANPDYHGRSNESSIDLHYTYSNDPHYQYQRQLQQESQQEADLKVRNKFGGSLVSTGSFALANNTTVSGGKGKPSNRLMKQLERYMGVNKKVVSKVK